MFELLVSGSLLFLLDQSAEKAVQTSLLHGSITYGKFLQIRHVVHRKKFYGRTTGRAALILVWFAALASVLWLRSSGAWFPHPL